MDVLAFRGLLATRLSTRARQLQPPDVLKAHIFQALLRSITSAPGGFEKRIYLLYEFSLIEKFVRFARRDDFAACEQWHEEIRGARSNYNLGPQSQAPLDVILNPALALVDYRRGEYTGAAAKLQVAISGLERYLANGVLEAGPVALEQRLNLIKVFCAFCSDEYIIDRSYSLISTIVSGSVLGSNGEHLPFIGTTADASVIANHYLDQIILKLARTRPNALVDLFALFSRITSTRDELAPIVRTLALLGDLATGRCERMEFPVVLIDDLSSSAISLSFIFSALTAPNAFDCPPPDDALSLCLASFSEHTLVESAIGTYRNDPMGTIILTAYNSPVSA